MGSTERFASNPIGWFRGDWCEVTDCLSIALPTCARFVLPDPYLPDSPRDPETLSISNSRMVEQWYVYSCADDGDEIGVKSRSYLFVALRRLMAGSYEDLFERPGVGGDIVVRVFTESGLSFPSALSQVRVERDSWLVYEVGLLALLSGRVRETLFKGWRRWTRR